MQVPYLFGLPTRCAIGFQNHYAVDGWSGTVCASSSFMYPLLEAHTEHIVLCNPDGTLHYVADPTEWGYPDRRHL